MNTQIRAMRLTMSPTVQEYAEKKMLSLQRFVKDSQVFCDVRLSRASTKHRSGEEMYRAEVSLRIGKDNIFAFSEKADIYQAVDDVRDELERILSSRKEKKMVTFRKGASRIKEMIKSITPDMSDIYDLHISRHMKSFRKDK